MKMNVNVQSRNALEAGIMVVPTLSWYYFTAFSLLYTCVVCLNVLCMFQTNSDLFVFHLISSIRHSSCLPNVSFADIITSVLLCQFHPS